MNDEYEAAAFVIATLLGCGILALILPPLVGKLLDKIGDL